MAYRGIGALALMFFFGISHAQEVWTLQRCIEHAYSNNLDIRQAELAVEQATVNWNQQRASMLPTLNANTGYSFNVGRSIDPFTNAFVNQTIASNNFGLSSGVTLFNAFRIQNSIRQAKSDLSASEAQTQVAKNNIALAIATAYLQILQSEEQLKAANEQVAATKANLDRSKKLEESGSVNALTRLNLAAQLSNDQLAVVNAQNQIRLGYTNLLNLLQMDPETDIRIASVEVGEIATSAEERISEIYNAAIQSLPEVEQARFQQQSADYQLKSAKALRYPTLSAFGNINTVWTESAKDFSITDYNTRPIGFVESSNDVVLTLDPVYTTSVVPYRQQINNNLGRSFGVGLSIPIFNQLQAHSAVKNAVIGQKMAQIGMDQTLNQIKNDIATAYSNLVAAESRYRAAVQSEDAQRKNFQFSEKRYEAGLLDVTQLTLAKSNWANATATLVQARYEWLFRKLIIQFYKGEELTLR
jgi:outer membrane protein